MRPAFRPLLILVLSALMAAIALAGCSSPRGTMAARQLEASGWKALMEGADQVIDKAFGSAFAGGDAGLAEFAYHTEMLTLERIADAEFRRALTWPNLILEYTHERDDEKSEFILRTYDGEALEVEIYEGERFAGHSTAVLEASLDDVKAAQPGVAGDVANAYFRVVANIDAATQAKRIRKISENVSGNYSFARSGGVGAGPPRHRPPPDPQTVAVQQKLNDRGYSCGPADGLLGAKTVQCLEAYQQDVGLPVTGRADSATLSLIGGTK